MALKPIFDKAPLTPFSCQPLRAGQVRMDHAALKQLYAATVQSDRPTALEGAFRLACLVMAHPDQEPVAARIRAALEAQREDGSFADCMKNSIAILRAAWALYEYEARKPILEHIARWCGWASSNWDALMEDDDVWANPADLLELLENLYRVTGKAAVLNLCERVSSQTMVWSSVLNTIAVQRPTNRSMTRDELQQGLARENGDRNGFYTHFYRTNHPESLSDGARSVSAKGWYSGSATEFAATRTAWERLCRYHGTVSGALTADELLEGTAPAGAASNSALGAWAEALCAAAMGENSAWAWDAIERMAYNALPATIVNGQVVEFQRANTLTEAAGIEDCFHVSADHAQRVIDRLSRGYTCVASSAVTARVDGMSVNLYLPGKYAVAVGESLIMLTIDRDAHQSTVQVHCKSDVKAALRLRIPDWSKNAEVAINGMDSDAGKDCKGGFMVLDRTWHDGDTITVTLEQTVRVMDGHHQGKYLLKGPIVMAMPVVKGKAWNVSFVKEKVDGNQVVAVLDTVADWKRKGDVPADLPVLPAASGDALTETVLQPYAACPARIALFPWRKQA